MVDYKKYCDEHKDCVGRISRLERDTQCQWSKMDKIATKLNIILGGIIISPFIVALITLLIKSK